MSPQLAGGTFTASQAFGLPSAHLLSSLKPLKQIFNVKARMAGFGRKLPVGEF